MLLEKKNYIEKNLKNDIKKFIPYNEQEEREKSIILRYMDVFDDLFTRENELAHFTASCWIVNKERTKILMIYHNIYKSWSWVGGHADGDEDLLRVALKETAEETGLEHVSSLSDDIFSIEIVGVDGHVKRGKFVGTHLHLNVTYLLEADEKDQLAIKPDENSGVKWISIDDVINECSEQYMKVIYQKLLDKINNIK